MVPLEMGARKRLLFCSGVRVSRFCQHATGVGCLDCFYNLSFLRVLLCHFLVLAVFFQHRKGRVAFHVLPESFVSKAGLSGGLSSGSRPQDRP